jgi:16S rRNA (adenine1518-N6/adenine1519-N6)-dimethyltransferase
MKDILASKKSLGQHWLNDAMALDNIAAAAQLKPDDVVLEIGPGPGALTRRLVKAAKQVVAVELDSYQAAMLPAAVPDKNLQVVQQDILSFDLTSLPSGYKVVANIPYYLTSNLIRVLAESMNPPSVAVLLIQKEVAERLAALPGATSLLSISAQFYFEVALDQIVKAEAFTPPPKVDSQVVVLRYRSQPLFDVDTKLFFRLVKAGFSMRRKTLLNSLSGGLHVSKADTAALLAQAEIASSLRAQALSMDDWHRLYLAYPKGQV